MSSKPIKEPTKWQRRILRIMILIGLTCMAFFLYSLLRRSMIGYRPLYWLLVSTFVYTLFKISFEWYHYWSISIPSTPASSRQYTVDVFTTFCAGEPYEMVIETLTAIQAITYPHQSYLCDEADDPYLAQVCSQLGVHHVTRVQKVDAKAGNINNALKISNGELCVVLDPDHRPKPDLLDSIVPCFEDDEIGFVQIVQAYHNHHTGWVAKGASQQTYQFYGPMMMCMNNYGTVQAIGANCTFRREALNSIGGHASGLAEDMHTAMHLHAAGWRSLYLPAVLTHGLVPATMSAYFKQQLKWSRGVFELLVTTYPRLFSKFTFRQKLHYGLVPMFYLSGFVFLLNFLIPIISLFADVYPLRMDFSHFVIISIPFITSVILIRHYVQRWVMDEYERGFHIIGGLLLIGTWWVFIVGFVYTVIRKKVPYIPTPKDLNDERSLVINLPNLAILIASVAAIVYGLINDWNPFTFFMAGAAGLNCLFMTFMIMSAAQFKLREIRRRLTFLAGGEVVIKELKGRFWIFRRRLYSGFRTIGLMLAVLTVCVCSYVIIDSGTEDSYDQPVYSHWYTRSGTSAVSGSKSDAARKIDLPKPNYFLSLRGVTYIKGQLWYKNTYPLTKKIIFKDFDDMRRAGFNTVKVYGPNVYDQSILEAARSKGMKVQYSFWIPFTNDVAENGQDREDLAALIIETVSKLKEEPTISSWNIGNYPIQLLGTKYRGKQLVSVRTAYLRWFGALVSNIKQRDAKRALTTDILATPGLQQTINMISKAAPALDAFGLILPNNKGVAWNRTDINGKFFFAGIGPPWFKDCVGFSGGVFYANWQDQEAASVVTVDGLKDKWGRNKRMLARLSNVWNGSTPANPLPDIRILRPAVTTTVGHTLEYRVMVNKKGLWSIVPKNEVEMKYEWYLIRTDAWGNFVAMTPAGTGPFTQVTMPPNTDNYRLYLVAYSDQTNSTSDLTTLNTPLVGNN